MACRQGSRMEDDACRAAVSEARRQWTGGAPREGEQGRPESKPPPPLPRGQASSQCSRHASLFLSLSASVGLFQNALGTGGVYTDPPPELPPACA